MSFRKIENVSKLEQISFVDKFHSYCGIIYLLPPPPPPPPPPLLAPPPLGPEPRPRPRPNILEFSIV